MQGDDSVKKESEVQRSGQSEANINKLLGQVEALNDDIADFIDENPVSDIPCAVEDLDQVINGRPEVWLQIKTQRIASTSRRRIWIRLKEQLPQNT